MRKAFGLLGDVAADVADLVKAQTQITVTDDQIMHFLDELFPASAADSDAEGRGRTIALNKRESVHERLAGMWGDYAQTKFGLLQAVDTAARWDWRTGGVERNLTKTLSGEFDKGIAKAETVLDRILVSA